MYGTLLLTASLQSSDHPAQAAVLEVLVAAAVYKSCASAMSAVGLVDLLRGTLAQTATSAALSEVARVRPRLLSDALNRDAC